MPAPLLFDLDGTLVDSAITIALALGQLSTSRGGTAVDVARVRRLVSQGATVLVREGLGPVAGDPAEDLAAFRTILADIPARPEMIFPGVIEALTELAAAGHVCAVVTNKPERLARLLLDQLDLTRHFAAVVGGDTLAVCKPDPAPLHHALDALGQGALGQATPAVMIGDSDVDARAAAAAGLPFALFLGGYEPDRCRDEHVAGRFARFAELPRLVRQIAALTPEPRMTG